VFAVLFTACKKDDNDKKDVTPPVITLKGNNPMVIQKGTNYTEPGYTAADDVDGDITDKVTSNNNINNNVDGYYTVNYNVSDKAGNKAAEKRTIQVQTF
jgi:hypothetical protein